MRETLPDPVPESPLVELPFRVGGSPAQNTSAPKLNPLFSSTVGTSVPPSPTTGESFTPVSVAPPKPPTPGKSSLAPLGTWTNTPAASGSRSGEMLR